MAFSEAHLKDEFLSNLDRTRDASALSLNDYNYGLLGGDTRRYATNSFQDQISADRVSIMFCRAVTQNGSRIEILDQELPGLGTNIGALQGDRDLSRSEHWYLLLVVDEFGRVPFGLEDEQERPRRKPHTRPTYSVELVPAHDLEIDYLANAIPLAKFRSSSNGAQKVDSYIPPCCRIDSHEQMVRVYEDFGDLFIRLHEFAGKVMDKVLEKRRANREQNRLADDIFALCSFIRGYHNDHIDRYRLTLKQQPPISLLSLFATFARQIEEVIAYGYDGNHLYSYFRQYASNLNEAELKAVLKSTFEVGYHHYDCMLAFERVQLFLQTYLGILERLVQLDYRELAPRGVVKQTGFEHSSPSSSWLKKRDSDNRLGGNLGD